MLAILYIALAELMLIDSSRELAEARRFRARVIAATLAENGAELAAARMIHRNSANVNASDWQGTISGQMRKTGNEFEINGDGSTTGVVNTSARVRLEGRIDNGNEVKVEFARHNP